MFISLIKFGLQRTNFAPVACLETWGRGDMGMVDLRRCTRSQSGALLVYPHTYDQDLSKTFSVSDPEM